MLVDHESWENIVQAAPVMAVVLNKANIHYNNNKTNVTNRERQEKVNIKCVFLLQLLSRQFNLPKQIKYLQKILVGTCALRVRVIYKRKNLHILRIKMNLVVCTYIYYFYNGRIYYCLRKRKKRHIQALLIENSRPRNLTSKPSISTETEQVFKISDLHDLARLVELQDDEVSVTSNKTLLGHKIVLDLFLAFF